MLTWQVPGFVGNNEPTFDTNAFDLSLINDRIVSSRDSWIFTLITNRLIGRRFKYSKKELAFEDDLDFKSRHPSNTFITSTSSF